MNKENDIIRSLSRIGLLRIDCSYDLNADKTRDIKERLLEIVKYRPNKTAHITNIAVAVLNGTLSLSAVCYKGRVFLGIFDKKCKTIHFVDSNNKIVNIETSYFERLALKIKQYDGVPNYQAPEHSTIYQAWKQTEPYLERAVEEMERFEELRDSSVTAIGSDKFLEHDSVLNHIALEYEAEMAIREYCKRNGITITSSYFDKNGAYYLNGEPFACLQEDGRVKLFQAKTEWQRFFIKRELNFGFPAESVYYELRTLQALLPLFMEISPFTENEPTVIRLIESSLWKDPALAKEQFEKIQKFVQSSRTPVQEEELSQEIQNFFDKSL